MNISQNITTHNKLRPFERIDVKTCPSCHSVFINKKGCEACGLQFRVDKLGEPFGERSFYSLNENYWDDQPVWVQKFPSLENVKNEAGRRYSRLLLKRYEVLIDFFLGNYNTEEERRKFFLIELQDLVKELKRRKVENQRLWTIVNDDHSHPFHAVLSTIIMAPIEEERPLSGLISNYNILGILKILRALTIVFLFFALVQGSIFFYQYQFAKR